MVHELSAPLKLHLQFQARNPQQFRAILKMDRRETAAANVPCRCSPNTDRGGYRRSLLENLELMLLAVRSAIAEVADYVANSLAGLKRGHPIIDDRSFHADVRGGDALVAELHGDLPIEQGLTWGDHPNDIEREVDFSPRGYDPDVSSKHRLTPRNEMAHSRGCDEVANPRIGYEGAIARARGEVGLALVSGETANPDARDEGVLREYKRHRQPAYR
jgi:hypothetical protein